MKEKVYVLDTNIILQNLQNLYKISDNKTNHIVIPETVLLELEDKKKLTNELGFYSREFARLLAKMKIKELDYKTGFKVVKLYDDDININIISKDRYDTSIEQIHISESNDKRIIEVASIAQEYFKGCQTIFLSLDVYARTFALFKGIKTETLHDDKSTVPKFNFLKSLKLDSSLFNSLENKDIKLVDDNYEIENFSYSFESDDGNIEYATIVNGKIDILKESDFKTLNIKPVNLKQKLFCKAILSNMFDLLVVDAKAGSGKTLMSIISAMRLIDLGLYDKIVYVRNSIESLDKGAEVGFLSGNDEKFRIYNMALYDTLEFIAKKYLKKSENRENLESISSKVEELQTKYCIETLWPGEARGRTLSASIVIMDEWQNSSEKTTQLILSRLDESCMAIVIGSNRQIDNLYLNKYNNGLTTLLKQTSQTHSELKMFAIELEKAVRGKFAEFTERIFENKNQ
ncbi:phosphate starvation-inducible protein PhoH [Aliarcobacter skirrowii]|jgi:PhoH-like ATPase|uniref:PhoH family protein n=1 Tax=Aliarcobacter skirrowii TaxID=28200 RepID=UPI0008267BFC|nr:PhoH family protein [Aliarcobacter skirrowii]MDX4040149.1 PhoH family protein [Aliarcobacter skirrowii]MDX4064507.1 PhoH family protein [Aliarcobacter skirrowii]MDY0180483.1 PhoH family protein [Aliarcobacter skirrowii]RXJ80433.1 phosphate starvation-inducible protein PhoH [Aliarcobacter skirrowii]